MEPKRGTKSQEAGGSDRALERTDTAGRSQPGPRSYLLMVLDAHAEGIDQDGDHDSPAKVLAVHNLPEGVTNQLPEGQHRARLCNRAQAPSPPAVGVPEVAVLGILCEFINSLAVGIRHLVVSRLQLPSSRPGTVGTAVRTTGSTVCLQARAGDLAGALAGTWNGRAEVRSSRGSRPGLSCCWWKH